MIPLQEAREYVLGAHRPLPARTVAVRDAVGTVLAQDVVSTEAIPPFANTAMDGFAVQASDTAGADDSPVTLDIVGTVAAGSNPSFTVGPGQAARIMTGAPMPSGADAVVMVERTTAEPGGSVVEVSLEVPVGNHVRPTGDDVQVGDRVFESGTPITPGHLGVLLSLGLTEVQVVPRPRVGVASTGDELIEGPQPLEPGQIRDSNRGTLLKLVEEMGAEAVDLGLVRDDEAAIEEALRNGAATCDALITSGGVSMGDFDFVKAVLSRIADMRWMQVAIKPAKPLAYGLLDGTPVFGLPGNPVSSMVSFELFARPSLRAMAGYTDLERLRVQAVADTSLGRRTDGKTHFARVRWEYRDGAFHVGSAGAQGSHQLSAMADANGLAVLPDGDGPGVGDLVELIVLGE
jgi:molybdenum cofactor synthesis domain-containing protein